MAISYTGWNTSPKKFKGKRVLTKANSCSTPCLFCPLLAEASSTYTHLTSVGVIWQKCFHFTFWWTVYGAAGCSLKQADLFWFIHSNSGDNFRAQITGNNFLCSSSWNRTGQSTNYWGTGAMDILPMLHIQCLSACKRIQNTTFIKRVDFAESNPTIVWLCVQKLPMSFMFYWKPNSDNQPVPVHQVQHWLKSSELYHLSLSLKGFQQIADIEEITQPFLVLGKEGGKDGRNYTLRTRLLYVCVWEVYTAAASVSLSVVTEILWSGFQSLCTFWCTWQSGTSNVYLIIYWKSGC